MVLRWLLQGGPDAKKHREGPHAVTTFFLHYAVVYLTTTMAHDWLVDQYQRKYSSHDYQQTHQFEGLIMECELNSSSTSRQSVAYFFGFYFLLFFAWRLAFLWKESGWIFWGEFYRQTFLCSVTILHVAVGLSTNRPILATAFCVAVGIDQLLWYIDLAVFAISGKFPIGVPKYLFWPGTTWASRLTSSHHLWTIPLAMWASNGIHILSLPLSAFVVMVNVLLSRLMTPYSVRNDDNNVRYMNLNLAYELWTDIDMKFLLVFEKQLPYLMRLFIGWWTFNSVVFALLYFAGQRIIGPAPLC